MLKRTAKMQRGDLMAMTVIDDRYRLKKKDVGGGNMSSIHLCIDMDYDNDDDNNQVIMKMFDKPTVGDEDLQKQVFNREVEALEKVNHKNVVRILDKGYDKGFNAYYIVLEYIKGKTFKEAYEDVCRYNYYQKIELMEQVIDGIEYLHKKNIVHRDLKPSNLMFDADNTVKIIDFGISRLFDTFYNDYTLSVYATKQYGSPEQIAGKSITYQSDIYSLGLIFYEIFSCRYIQTRETMDVSDLPKGIQNILIKMTKEEVNLRYSSISEVKKDLQHERSLLIQEKFLGFGFTNKVAKKLYDAGRIDKEENALALNVLENEYSGKCYILPHKDLHTKEFDHSFELYGKQFISMLKIDLRDNTRFTVISVRFIDASILLYQKEIAYEIPYEIKVVGASARIRTDSELDANILVEEVMAHESENISRRDNDMHMKDITGKWKDILGLERQQLEQEKATLQYRNLEYDENDASIEIDIDTNKLYEINFTSDDMLQMRTRKSTYKQIDVGRMREFSNGKMIIDLAPQVDTSNIALTGEISISMRMAEIALQRQSRALKNIQFKENVNPIISDIIFKPETAKSKNNLMLTAADCKSDQIDKSKLVSLEKALSAEDLFLLQGPPGTGKTTFISELVYQILNGNSKIKGNLDVKILIASQSHVAVDHSLNKIKKLIPDIKMIRIGVIDKMAETSRDFTLDVFCREWTKQVIENCKEALLHYKTEIGIDETLQEKNSIISEIERLINEIVGLNGELEEVENGLEKINVLDQKWSFVNDRIASMKQMVSIKTTGITEDYLVQIIDDFTDNLQILNEKLFMVIDESVDLAEQKQKLEARHARIDDEVGIKSKEITDWKEILGITSQEKYLDIKKEIATAMKENTKKYAQYSKVENLCNEWQKRVTQGDGLLQESLSDATLVGATCLGIASLSDNVDSKFDWVIVDEAGKATPPEILVPICLGRKVILVGDHKQLPPVVDETLLKLQDKERTNLTKQDLELSLFEYLERRLSDACKSVLDEQYRMNPVIGDLISEMFYDKKLISRTSREEMTIPLKMYQEKPLVWLTTSNNTDKKEEHIGDTFRNMCEAKIIFEQLLQIDGELCELKQKKEAAIIAGYRGQRDVLTRLYESQYAARFHNMKVEINTVDAFQGRETDIVFYSVVRSNDKGALGFLKDVRRLNVAFSRARELLIVVGDHSCAQRQTEINGQKNPFVGIIGYIYSHMDDCLMKEV